jgi:hypothetical protein
VPVKVDADLSNAGGWAWMFNEVSEAGVKKGRTMTPMRRSNMNCDMLVRRIGKSPMNRFGLVILSRYFAI